MTKLPLPLIVAAAILAVLANNLVFYQDIIFNRHGGAILMGTKANAAVFICVVLAILSILVLGGVLASKFVKPFYFQPEVTKNRHLSRIRAHLEEISGKLGDQAQESKELLEFVALTKKEVDNLNSPLPASAGRWL